MASSSSSSSYVCDTLPAARLAAVHNNNNNGSNNDYSVPDELPPSPKSERDPDSRPLTPPAMQQPPPRKLCFRHQRMADEGTNLKLQQSLDALPLQEREQVNAVWSAFSSSSHPRRALILQGLLTMCCFSQLSLLTEQLAHLIRIDPFAVLPREVGLKVLMYLDATSLCRAAQVSKRWKSLADDNILWRGICEQHIGQKCTKCGWGLPILEKKRVVRLPSPTPSQSPQPSSSALLAYPLAYPSPSLGSNTLKRSLDNSVDLLTPPLKRQRSDESSSADNASSLIAPFTSLLTTSSATTSSSSNCVSSSSSPPTEFTAPPPPTVTRPWKDVYSERMTIERNWRRGRCTVRTLKGHTDGVMCLQFSETLQCPAFPVLITGSYDRTVRVWNMETGVELHCLKGHTRAVRALQFDEVKLITGSMDSTIKVWDWRRGKCIRTLTGHAEGVVSLNYDSNVLASGSVDATIKVWNLRTGGAFTLRGHSDWVNSVQLWDSNPTDGIAMVTSSDGASSPCPPSSTQQQPCWSQIDPGKMLFSASDDGTIRLWDLTQRVCIKQFTGHVGQVQSMRLVVDECDGPEEDENTAADKVDSDEPMKQIKTCSRPPPISKSSPSNPTADVDAKRKKPLLISGSLDNTIKMWDIESGKTVRTFFGHIEGVWAVASDKLRLVSGSHDRTIKVWSREEGKCTATLVGHQAAVSCLALGEDKIVSGSDDNDIKIWSFSG